jgi:hypothetical protein
MPPRLRKPKFFKEQEMKKEIIIITIISLGMTGLILSSGQSGNYLSAETVQINEKASSGLNHEDIHAGVGGTWSGAISIQSPPPKNEGKKK